MHSKTVNSLQGKSTRPPRLLRNVETISVGQHTTIPQAVTDKKSEFEG